MNPIAIVIRVISFYEWLIIGYVLMSWFPVSGVFEDIRRVLASLVEPYLGLFRRFIPPIGMMDISPIVAIIVLQVFRYFLARFAGGL